MQPWDLHVAMLISYTLPGAHCVGVARGILLLWCTVLRLARSTLDLRHFQDMYTLRIAETKKKLVSLHILNSFL